jgi:metal-dependent HD superfamily phosphatase/phosphodiesterase
MISPEGLTGSLFAFLKEVLDSVHGSRHEPTGVMITSIIADRHGSKGVKQVSAERLKVHRLCIGALILSGDAPECLRLGMQVTKMLDGTSYRAPDKTERNSNEKPVKIDHHYS